MTLSWAWLRAEIIAAVRLFFRPITSPFDDGEAAKREPSSTTDADAATGAPATEGTNP